MGNVYFVGPNFIPTHSFTDSFLRKQEKRILVHSTTLLGFKSILHDKMLKSCNILKFEEKKK